MNAPTLFVAVMAMQQTAALPPPMLDEALKTLPGVRLAASTDAAAWLLQDTDRDQQPDVVAVVVKRSAGRSEFGVIAVHARTPREIHWIIPLDADPISGVTKGKAADIVIPLFCVDCDSNLWFRWSGEEYEPELYAVGEELELGSETQADLPLYSSPNLASKPVTKVPHCTTAVVRKVGGTPDKRWYFVETPEGQGWVADDVTSGNVCVG
jgi:hypothetical protein